MNLDAQGLDGLASRSTEYHIGDAKMNLTEIQDLLKYLKIVDLWHGDQTFGTSPLGESTPCPTGIDEICSFKARVIIGEEEAQLEWFLIILLEQQQQLQRNLWFLIILLLKEGKGRESMLHFISPLRLPLQQITPHFHSLSLLLVGLLMQVV
ncbi:hypothetical protein HHK36_031625 [Tetracentron sinense]|uniref:Uncharacterized protein n=1 Tax=Tetracentron sinense TaxID=13715 RepID=A0A835D183_TETSI|nr:hypothetical protein HHK36_031625 [Tetracentron sinense]